MKTTALKEDVQSDAFLQRGRATAAWLGRRTHLLRLGLLIVLLVVVSLAWVNKSRRKNAEQASAAFAEGVALLSEAKSLRQSPSESAEDPRRAGENREEPAPPHPKKTGELPNYERAAGAFERAIRLVGARGVGAMATILLAETEVRRGEREQARSRLQAILRDISSDRPLYFLAAQSLSALEEGNKDLEAATAPLRALAEERSRPYADWAAWSLARLALMRGDTSEAKERLDRLELEFSQTTLADDVARLRARLSRPVAENSPS